MTMIKEPTCLYCGCEMNYIYRAGGGCQYECPRCGSNGPRGVDAREAHAKMMQRYEPPARPLTWEKLVLRKDDVVYFEDFGVGEILVALLLEITPEYAHFRDSMRFFYVEKNDMNTQWRAWSRKPTEEERRTAEWIS